MITPRSPTRNRGVIVGRPSVVARRLTLISAARHSWSAAGTFKFAQTAAASGCGTCRHPVPGQWQSTPCPAPKEGLGNLGFQADFWFLLFSDKRNPPPGRRNFPSPPGGGILPYPAFIKNPTKLLIFLLTIRHRSVILSLALFEWGLFGGIAQVARAYGSYP